MNKYAHLTTSQRTKKREIFSAVRGAASACMHKTPFKTEDAAKTRAAEITAEGVPMRYYKCPHCYNYHLARIKPLTPATCRKG